MIYTFEVAADRQAVKKTSDDGQFKLKIINEQEDSYGFLFPLVELLNEIRTTESTDF